MMNFFEAMTALQNGRKIRRLDWKEGQWVGLKEQQFKLFGLPKFQYSLVNQSGSEAKDFEFHFCVAGDWEEFKESKQ